MTVCISSNFMYMFIATLVTADTRFSFTNALITNWLMKISRGGFILELYYYTGHFTMSPRCPQ